LEEIDIMENTEKIKVLVADDEESIRDILADVLGDDGYDIIEAQDGQEALELCHKLDIHIVLTDIRMPKLTGLELLEKIKKEKPGVEVIIMTSHASIASAQSAIRNGAYDYLVKPFESLDVISDVVSRAVETLQLNKKNQSFVEELKEKNEELIETNSSLKELAVKDGLTGLYNVRYFSEAIKNSVALSKRNDWCCSLLFIDVDHFKEYNDTYGHQAGDDVLVGLAKVLTKDLRSSDLLARYGGEEFVYLLPKTDKASAKYVADKICKNVEASTIGRESDPSRRNVTISLGVSTYPEDGEDADKLIEAADQRLYKAKENGRNQAYVD